MLGRAQAGVEAVERARGSQEWWAWAGQDAEERRAVVGVTAAWDGVGATTRGRHEGPAKRSWARLKGRRSADEEGRQFGIKNLM